MERSAVCRASSRILWNMEIISIYAEGKPNYLYWSFIQSFLFPVLFSVQLYNWSISAFFHRACGCWSLANLIDMSRTDPRGKQTLSPQQGSWLSLVNSFFFFFLYMTLELYFKCKSSKRQLIVSYLSWRWFFLQWGNKALLYRLLRCLLNLLWFVKNPVRLFKTSSLVA